MFSNKRYESKEDRLTFIVPNALWEEIGRAAARYGMSKSGYARVLLSETEHEPHEEVIILKLPEAKATDPDELEKWIKEKVENLVALIAGE